MLSGLKSFAADDAFIETYIMDGTSQPPVAGGIISDNFTGTISERGLILTTSNIDFSYDGTSCANFKIVDCTDITTEGQFMVALKGLKGNKTYYLRAYLKTDDNVYYGNIKEIKTQNFNRSNAGWDYANVQYRSYYTLFDLMSDEIIDGGFYYSTNEYATSYGYSTDYSKMVYKFKTVWSYQLWYSTPWSTRTNFTGTPILTFKNGNLIISKNTVDANKNVRIYYCINGDYKRPENFTDIYSDVIRISEPSVIACYATDDEGILSNVVYFVVTENMLNKNINIIDKTPYAREEPTDKYSTINYIRTFGNTNWQALYIPFSMSYKDWKDDFEIAYINNIRQLDTDDDGAIDKTIMDVVKIKSGITAPNTPYLIKSKTTGEKTISVSNATLHKSEEKSEDCSTTIVKYTFTGTYSTIPASTLIANNYYTMSEGSLCMPNATSDLLPYRWYMKAESRNSSYNISNSAKIITINVVGEEEEGMTTDIHQVGFNAESSSVIYDLNGRKVMEKALKPGLYIRNGKKVVVK